MWRAYPNPSLKGRALVRRSPGSFFGSQRDKEAKRRRDEESKRRRDGESKRRRDEESKRWGDEEAKRQRDKEAKNQRDEESKRRREFEQGLFNGRSMVVQWSFNGCSMVGVVFPGRRGKFSPRRGKKTGCLVRRSDRVDFALV